MSFLKDRILIVSVAALFAIIFLIIIGFYLSPYILNMTHVNTDIQPQDSINLSQAKITAPDAIQIASGQYPNMFVTNTSAILYFKKIESKQQLVWDVYINGGYAVDSTGFIAIVNGTDNISTGEGWVWGGIVTVDAITGKVLQVNQEV